MYVSDAIPKPAAIVAPGTFFTHADYGPHILTRHNKHNNRTVLFSLRTGLSFGQAVLATQIDSLSAIEVHALFNGDITGWQIVSAIDMAAVLAVPWEPPKPDSPAITHVVPQEAEEVTGIKE